MPTPNQRLIHAVRSRNYQRLRELISDGNDVASRSAAGRTALHAAAEEGDVGAAKILIAAGADVNVRMQDGQTPLHLAAAYGGACDLADPDLDRRDPCTRRRNRSCHPKVAEVLMDLIRKKHPSFPPDLKADDTLPNEHKADAFIAVLDFLTEPQVVLKEIVSRGINLDELDPDFAEQLRGNPRFLEVVNLLLDHGADIKAVDEQGNPVLRGAVELGKVEMVELLLKRGSSPHIHRAGDPSVEPLDRSSHPLRELLISAKQTWPRHY